MRFHRTIKASMFVFAVLFCMFIESSAFASDKAKAGEVIVVFRNQSQKLSLSNKTTFKARELQVKSAVKSMGAEVIKTYSALSEAGNNMFVLVHSDTKTEDELLKDFHMRPDVSAVSLNYRTSYEASQS